MRFRMRLQAENGDPMRAFIYKTGIALACYLFLAGFAAADETEFDIWEIRVQGNTLLAGKDIERLVYPYLGEDRTFDDVQKVRTALESAYREAGYPTVYVDVPEQSVRKGLIKIRVTEGKIGRVKVTGSRYFSNGWIRSNLPEAEEGSVPRLAEFNVELAQLNSRTGDRRITPVLRPGKAPGTVELELKVKDKIPFHAALELNNRATVDTTDTRLIADVSYDNLWQKDHKIGLLYQVAPENSEESEVWSLNYSFRPQRSSTSYAFFGIKSNSNIETSGAIGVLGKGSVLGARVIQPLPAGDTLFHSVILGADYKDFDETIFNQGTSETPITYLNWTAGYSGAILGKSRRHNFFGSINFGVRGLVNDQEEFSGGFATITIPNPNPPPDDIELTVCDGTGKRCDTRANYFYLRGSYDVEQALPFGTSGFLRMTGQWTNQPLISNEQYSIGGMDTVRGYFEAEALGDYGAHASLEFRTPDFGGLIWGRIKESYFYLFADGGRLGSKPVEGDTDEDRTVRLFSTGAGYRFDALGLTASFMYAYPLQDGPVTQADEERWLFRVRYGF